MITLLTPLSAFRVPSTKSDMMLSYGEAVEVVAGLAGEPITRSGMCTHLVDTIVEGTRFYARVNDELHLLPYRKETLCRHFQLFRDFVSEHPLEDTVPLIVDDYQLVLDTIEQLFSVQPEYKLTDCMYTLQLLNPVCNAVPLLFSLEGVRASVVGELVGRLTAKERSDLICAHNAQRRLWHHKTHCIRYLPLRGEGNGVLACVDAGADYLRTEEGASLLPQCTSWLFINSIATSQLESELFDRGFNDLCDPLERTDEELVKERLLKFTIYCSNTRFSRACAMLGVKHSLLSNEQDTSYPPFQVCRPLLYAPNKLVQTLRDKMSQLGIHDTPQLSVPCLPQLNSTIQ